MPGRWVAGRVRLPGRSGAFAGAVRSLGFGSPGRSGTRPTAAVDEETDLFTDGFLIHPGPGLPPCAGRSVTHALPKPSRPTPSDAVHFRRFAARAARPAMRARETTAGELPKRIPPQALWDAVHLSERGFAVYQCTPRVARANARCSAVSLPSPDEESPSGNSW